MKPGYTDALAALLEGQPAIARPIVEILDIIASDIKNTKVEFQGADLGAPGMFIFEQGGCRLAGVLGDLSDQPTSGGTTLSMDNAPTDGTKLLGAAQIIWDSPAFLNYEIDSIRVELTNPVGGNAAEFFYAQLFRVAIKERITEIPLEDVYTLQPLAGIVQVPAVAGTTQDYAFQFSDGFVPIPIGAPPIIIGSPAFPQPEAATVVFVWGVKTNGDPADLAEWEATSGIAAGPPTQSRLSFDNRARQTYDFEVINQLTPAGPFNLSIQGRTYVEDTIEWSINRIDLGQVPDPANVLQCTTQKSEPGNSIVKTELDDFIGGYVEFVDGDIIGKDNTPDGGKNLQAVVVQQTYNVRGTLTPSTDTQNSPRLLTIGVNEVSSELTEYEMEMETAEWVADPLSCQAEIATASGTLRRDGIKDYRSFGEELISENVFAALIFRLWIGHPTLPKSEWLYLDDMVMRNYDPSSTDGIKLDLMSGLFNALESLPALIDQDRTPIVYSAATLAFVWEDIFALLGTNARLIGQGPTDTNVVTRTIDTLIPAVDLLQEISFLAGGVTVTSQGVFKWVSLFDSGAVVATIDRADYDLLGWDVGTDRRLTVVDIEYGGTLEKAYVAPDAVLVSFGGIGSAGGGVLPGRVSDWLPDVTLPDIVGSRLIDNFATGVSKLRVRCRTPRPWLEIGDVVSIEQDRFVGVNPSAGSAIRGNFFTTARVVGVHDLMGQELTLFVQGLSAIQRVEQEPGLNALGVSRTTLIAYAGEDFRPARWPMDMANTVGAMGAIQSVRGAWEWWGGAVTVTSSANGQDFRAVLPLPLFEGAYILSTAMVAEIPVGTLTAELVEYPVDGSPRIVLATYSFTDTVGRVTDETLVPQPGITVERDATYTVEVTCADLDDGDFFSIYAFALEIREVL